MPRKPERILRRRPTRYFVVPELDGLLHMWEEFWFWQEEAARHNFRLFQWQRTKAFQSYQAFRAYVLAALIADPNLNRIGEFGWPEALNDETRELESSVMNLKSTPHEFASWSCGSRRVYRLDRSLQTLLSLTSMGGLKMTDIHLPHSSFFLRLAYPLSLPREGKASAILVSTEPSTNRMRVHLIGEKVPAFMHAQRPTVEVHAPRQPMSAAAFGKKYEQFIHCVPRHCQGALHYLPIDDEPIERTLRTVAGCDADRLLLPEHCELSVEDFETCTSSVTAALRIALGFAAYLQNIPLGAARSSEWKPLIEPGVVDPTCVTDAAQLCSVECFYELSPAERAVLERGPQALGELGHGQALNWGFVRGYWRRLPGLGNVPGAPRTERVRPYMRRSDRAPETGVPHG